MPLMSTSWNLSKDLQLGLSPVDGLTTMTPCSATSIGQSYAPEERSRNLLCNRILNNCSILPPSLFAPHPSPHLRHNHPYALYYPTCHSTAQVCWQYNQGHCFFQPTCRFCHLHSACKCPRPLVYCPRASWGGPTAKKGEKAKDTRANI